MQEEQSGSGSANYDVELIHLSEAHRDILRGGMIINDVIGFDNDVIVGVQFRSAGVELRLSVQELQSQVVASRNYIEGGLLEYGIHTHCNMGFSKSQKFPFGQ